MYFKTGRLVSYLYSLSDNRDVMKKHDPAKNYNLYWELLLSSAKKPLKGFALTENIRKDQMEYEIDREDDRIAFYFGKPDDNQAGILEIQKGILDFVVNMTGILRTILICMKSAAEMPMLRC